MRKSLLDYWCNPPVSDNNCPMDYYDANGWIRSGNLVNYLINRIHLDFNAHIFEVGCGVGRNLAVLKFAGFCNVSGLELSSKSVEALRSMMPVLDKSVIHLGPAEDVLNYLPSKMYELVYTMAVLEHIPPESEQVFNEMVRISSKYILTIEDEKTVSHRHFPRNYKQVFKKFGLRQIDEVSKLDGLSSRFRLRLFLKRGEE